LIRNRLRFVIASLLLGALALAMATQQPSDAAAQRPSGDRAKAKNAKRQLIVTPEREAAAITFVEQHHAELAGLLNSLRVANPREYQRALRDLFRTSERLTQLRERDSDLYKLELQNWRLQSRIQLLVAQLRMSDSDEHRQQLRESLERRVDVRIAILQHNRAKMADRLKNIDEQISQHTKNRDRQIESQLKMLLRSDSKARSEQPKSNTPVKPKSKSAPKTTAPLTRGE